MKPALTSDTVQFTGKHKKPEPLSESVQGALDFADEIYPAGDDYRTLEDLENAVSKRLPEIEVFDSKELQKYRPGSEDYGAMYISTLNDDFELEDKKLFFAPQTGNDPNEKLLFTMCASHEFTHALQGESGRTINFLKSVTGEDVAQAKIIMAIGERLFTFFDTQLQTYSSLDVMRNTISSNEIAKYNGALLPKEADVSKKDIFASLRKYSDIKNENYFRSSVNKRLKSDFNKTLEHIKTYQPEDYKNVPYKNQPEKLYKIIKQYVCYKALDEYEAYQAEAEIAKKMIGKKKINLDIIPIYYQTLQEALKDN